MLIETSMTGWKKLLSANGTDTSFAARKSTLTRPSGSGVIDAGDGTFTRNAILLRPFGTDTNNNTFLLRVLGWNLEISTNSWEYALLADLSVTLGNIQGTAGCAIAAADFEADTITEATAMGVDLYSPTADVRGAFCRIDTQGAQIIEILGNRNSSAATWNTLYRFI
jgi:hypothetical protein